MSRKHTLTLLAIVAAGRVGAALPQEAPASTAPLFVPSSYVPLSEFAPKAGSTVVLHVEPEVLDWIVDNHPGSVRVALRQSSGPMGFLTPSGVDVETGEVTLNSTFTGDCVVVSLDVEHDTAIVTHWDESLNSGRGGRSEGATDGIFMWDYDPVSGVYERVLPCTPPPTVPGLYVPIVPCGSPPSGTLAYNTSQTAYFSDGSGVHDGTSVTVPDFERYVAENWAISGATPLAAIWLSDQARYRTGFPLAHRNHPDAFTSSSAAEALQDDLPLFQVVHGYEVAPEDGAPDGYEHSLATFLLPPGWIAEPTEAYPALFIGLYDINDSTFGANGSEVGVGLRFLETLGELYRHTSGPRRAVGLLWNGGGAAATLPANLSAYINVNQLFEDATTLLGIDRDQLVFTGGSRGGTTALAMASNPYGAYHDYTVLYVNARDPETKLSTLLSTHVNPTYSLLTGSIGGVTGYTDSFTCGWEDPVDELTMAERAALVLTGTTDLEQVDELHAIDSEDFIDTLVDEGTQVILSIGTNDYTKPVSQMVEYANHLAAAGVPLKVKLFYRFGHVSPYTDPSDADLLNMVIDGAPAIDETTEYFGRSPCDPEEAVAFDSTHVPLAFEWPIYVGSAQDFSCSFLGQPGSTVDLVVRKLASTWTLGQSPSFVGSPLPFYLELDAETGDAFASESLLIDVVDSSCSGYLTPGWWWYEATYTVPGESYQVTLGAGDSSDPTGILQGQPVFFVDSAAEIVGIDLGARTGGLAEDGRLLSVTCP